jgi:hypothetical protein
MLTLGCPSGGDNRRASARSLGDELENSRTTRS